jgi:hypothetical protein
MYRTVSICVVLLVAWSVVAWAETPSSTHDEKSSVCTFDDGKELSVKYELAPVKRDTLPEGTPWSPGKSPMFLFTSAALKIGDSEVPVGAYSLYVIPGSKQWILAVNKNVSGSRYDQKQDVLRARMDLGTLGSPEKKVSIAFAHLSAKQCSLRIYYGKTGAWVEFDEQ